MRIHVDLATDKIVQVESGAEPVALNGKYIIPLPPGVTVPINANSYLSPRDGGDVASRVFAGILAKYPQFTHVHFNPLLVKTDLAELDLETAVEGDSPRYQIGREGAEGGLAPNMVALLPANDAVDPSRPGLIGTGDIDVSVGEDVGASQVMLYWRVCSFNTTHDIAADHGAHAGINEPALKMGQELDDSGVTGWITPDDGASYCRARVGETISFDEPTSTVKLAFRNETANKLYLIHYALLYRGEE